MGKGICDGIQGWRHRRLPAPRGSSDRCNRDPHHQGQTHGVSGPARRPGRPGREGAIEEPTNWSRRYKANSEKLASGDVIRVAEVVRDLSRRDAERGLSAGEKRMLANARHILISELALAEQTNEDKAEALLDEVLAS